MPVHAVKVCGGMEIQLHSFSTPALNGASRQPNASATLIRNVPTVPPVPTGPGGLPSLLYNGYRFIPGGEAAGAWR
jgi:hypothetical protein